MVLAEYRAQGLPFVTAWMRTLQSIDRGSNAAVVVQRREWIAELRWSRPAWEAAYRGVPLEQVLAGAAAAEPELTQAA